MKRSFLPGNRALSTILLFGLLLSPARATDYFVDPANGSDSRSGRSHSQAWRSDSNFNGSDKLSTSDRVFILCGTTINLKTSTYHNRTLSLRWGGRSSAWAKLGAYSLQSGNEITDYETVRDAIKSGQQSFPLIKGGWESGQSDFGEPLAQIYADYFAVENLRFEDASGQAIRVDSRSNITIRHTWSEYCYMVAISVKETPGGVLTIEDNTIIEGNNEEDGYGDTYNIYVYNNLICNMSAGLMINNGGGGADLDNIHFYHNTVVSCGTAFGTRSDNLNSDMNCTVRNNIFQTYDGGAMFDKNSSISLPSGWSFRDNLWSGPVPSEVEGAGTIEGQDAELVRKSGWTGITAWPDVPSPDDFRLAGAHSPACAAGTVVSACDTDHFGTRRGAAGDACDLGAIELAGIELQVSSGSDDAEERTDTGAVSLTSQDLELVRDAANQIVGVRFTNVEIPRAGVIKDACLEFVTDEANDEPTTLLIEGEAADDAAPFVANAGNLHARARTAANTSWTPYGWSTIGKPRQTPDISAVIQEIVDRPGWQSGNALVFLISGTGKRVVTSYDGDPDDAPRLLLDTTFYYTLKATRTWTESDPSNIAGATTPNGVAQGTLWKYRKGTAEASTPATAWRTLQFDDSAWAEGPAPFGYGDVPYGTEFPDMRGNYTCLFLRRTFEVENPAAVSGLHLDLLYDDGFIVWLNGQEVARHNMSGAPGTFNPCSDVADGGVADGTNLHLELADAAAPPLRSGPNVLAVQVFNRHLSDSSDLTLGAAVSLVIGHWSSAEDADQDGMPDAWEEAYLSELSDQSELSDPDNDGLCNLEEYIAGTDPRDETGNWKLETRLSNGQVEVSFGTVPASGPGYESRTRRYSLQQRTADSAHWRTVQGYENIVVAGQTVTYLPPPHAEATVYRARVWLE